MAEEETTTTEASESTEATGSSDSFKNIKAEMDRKLKNIDDKNESRFDALKKANDELINVLNANNNTAKQKAEATQSASTEDAIDDAWFSDPAKAKQLLKDNILDEFDQRLAKNQQVQSQQQAKFNELASDFPELYKSDSDLVKKAGEHYAKLTGAQRNSSEFVEGTILKAALELGLRPKSQRTDDDNEFVGGSKQPNRSSKKKDGTTDFQMAFAKAMGRPVKDKKYQERLAKYASRKNWGMYQGEVE